MASEDSINDQLTPWHKHHSGKGMIEQIGLVHDSRETEHKGRVPERKGPGNHYLTLSTQTHAEVCFANLLDSARINQVDNQAYLSY